MKLTCCRNSNSIYNPGKNQKDSKKPKEDFLLHGIRVTIEREEFDEIEREEKRQARRAKLGEMT